MTYQPKTPKYDPNYKHSAIPKNRARGSALVLDGGEVKLRLQAERLETKSVVHVDWVRFTALRRNCEPLDIDKLFPAPVPAVASHSYADLYNTLWSLDTFTDELKKPVHLSDDEAVSLEAQEMAVNVAAALGSEFNVAPELKKGLDFYKFRWSIQRHGAECGWVGFLSSSDSPRQQDQSRTIHVNLFGAACTFAASGWSGRVADLVDDCKGVLTRCDLALDFFDGIPGGLDSIVTQYQAGLCNVGGKKPKSNCIGDWFDKKRGRSFYLGSKEAGKQTNAYEKGDQLFGIDSGSEWLRVELRYGNKLRVLTPQMLRDPASYFAGASDWHESLIHLADSLVVPEPVPCAGRLPVETVKAECVRSLRWLKNTAAASMALAFEFLGVEEFVSIVSAKKLPGRLAKFSRAEIQAQLTPALASLSLFELSKVAGTHATYTVNPSPSFA